MKVNRVFIIVPFLVLCFGNASPADFTLKQCIEYALKNNISIKTQELASEQSQIQYDQAKSRLLPWASGNADYGWNLGRSRNPITNGYQKSNSASSGIGVNAGITLYDGMSNFNTIAMRSIELQVAALDLQSRSDQIALSIASSYLKILLDNELIVSAKTQLTITEEAQKKLEIRFAAGSISKEAILNNKAQLALEKAQLIEKQNNQKYDLLILAQMLEIQNPDSFNIIQPTLPVLKAEWSINNAQELFAKSVDLRPDVHAAKLQVDVSRKNYQIAKAGHYPTINLGASYGADYNNKNNGNIVQQFADNYGNNIQFTMKVPIFNQFQTKNQIKLSNIQIRRYEFEYESQRKAFRETIQKAYANAKAAFESMHAYKESLDASEEAFRFAQQRLDVQAISIFDYNELKNKTEQTRSQYLQSMYQFIFASKILDFYDGVAIEL